MTKSTKSHQRERSPLFENSSRVHELVAGSSAWQVRATQNKAKVGGFAALRNLSYTTRANIAHEKAEQIRARIVRTPAESAGIDRFAKQTRSASPRQGKRAWVESVRRRDYQQTSYLAMFAPRHAPKLEPRGSP